MIGLSLDSRQCSLVPDVSATATTATPATPPSRHSEKEALPPHEMWRSDLFSSTLKAYEPGMTSLIWAEPTRAVRPPGMSDTLQSTSSKVSKHDGVD